MGASRLLPFLSCGRARPTWLCRRSQSRATLSQTQGVCASGVLGPRRRPVFRGLRGGGTNRAARFRFAAFAPPHALSCSMAHNHKPTLCHPLRTACLFSCYPGPGTGPTGPRVRVAPLIKVRKEREREKKERECPSFGSVFGGFPYPYPAVPLHENDRSRSIGGPLGMLSAGDSGQRVAIDNGLARAALDSWLFWVTRCQILDCNLYSSCGGEQQQATGFGGGNRGGTPPTRDSKEAQSRKSLRRPYVFYLGVYFRPRHNSPAPRRIPVCCAVLCCAGLQAVGLRP